MSLSPDEESFIIELAKCNLDLQPGDKNWVSQVGGLDPYLHEIACSLVEKRGMSISRAIATAWSRLKVWAAGGKGVSPKTQAKAAAALANMEAKQARAKSDNKVKASSETSLGKILRLCASQASREINLCADEFSIDSVKRDFSKQFPTYSVKELWTRYIIALDKDGNEYRVDYRVDDEDFVVGFGVPKSVNNAVSDKLVNKDVDNISDGEIMDMLGDSGDIAATSALGKILALAAAPGVKAKKSAPKPYGSVNYADPGYRGKARYPLDSEAHCRAAWSYIQMPKNRKFYSAKQLSVIESRIKAAAVKFGIDIKD